MGWGVGAAQIHPPRRFPRILGGSHQHHHRGSPLLRWALRKSSALLLQGSRCPTGQGELPSFGRDPRGGPQPLLTKDMTRGSKLQKFQTRQNATQSSDRVGSGHTGTGCDTGQ